MFLSVNQTPCAELLPGHKIVNTLGITIPESFVDTNPSDDPNNCRFIFVTEASKADLITLDPYSETKQAIEKMDGTIKDFLQNSGTFPLTEADIIQLGNKLVDDYWKSILEPSCDDDEGDACSTQTLNDCVTESAMNIKQWADAKTWVRFFPMSLKAKRLNFEFPVSFCSNTFDFFGRKMIFENFEIKFCFSL